MDKASNFYNVINIVNTLNEMVAMEYGENGVKFKKVHNKIENI